MRHLVLAACCVGLFVSTARAESWVNSMGDVLKTSKRVEIIEVTGSSATTIDGTVAVAIRSTNKVGATVHIAQGIDHPNVTAGKGDRVLVICDGAQCPRAIGIERDGMFDLVAHEPGDSADVWPSLVEAKSVADLAAGKAVPDLCVRGTVDLVDERVHPSFEVAISAVDGKGKGTVDGTRVVVSPSFNEMFTLSTTSGGTLRLHQLQPFTRQKDGCVVAGFVPQGPLPRSAKGLARALAGKVGPSVIARGTLDVPAKAPVAAGRYPIEVSVDGDGNLVVTSDVVSGANTGAQSTAAGARLFFPLKAGVSTTYTTATIDFGSAGMPLDIARVLASKPGKARAVVTARTDSAAVDVPLGVAELAYVRER